MDLLWVAMHPSQVDSIAFISTIFRRHLRPQETHASMLT
jgi:hypothetical protein